MKKTSFEKIRRLKQKEDVWEVAARLSRTWVESDDGVPYRPWYVMVVSEDNKVVYNGIFEQRPGVDEIREELFKAMLRPMLGAGGKHRPRKVVFDDEYLSDELAAVLTEAGVESGYRRDLICLNGALSELEKMLNRGYPEPDSLLSISGITVPLLGNIFNAAADFYHVAPWKKLPYEVAIAIRFPVDSSPRYAVVMGDAGESFGLFVSNNLGGLQRIFNQFDPQGLASEINFLSLSYDTAVYFSFDDLDAIKRYHWPIPNARAFPSIMRFTPEQEFHLPSQSDMFWLEAVLPALSDFFENHFKLVDGDVPHSEYALEVSTLGGPVRVGLQMPIDVSLGA